jgi:hypothetical protein
MLQKVPKVDEGNLPYDHLQCQSEQKIPNEN